MLNTLTSDKLFVHDDPIIAKKVQYYAEWLANDGARNCLTNSAKKIAEYEYIAIQPTVVKGQEVVTFAPFQQKFSAMQTTAPKKTPIVWWIVAIYMLGRG